MVPVEGVPGWEGRLAFTIRVPVGVVCAITPFNSPLNTLLHKVAPAIAAGNAVVLKPATLTPLTAVKVCRLFEEAGLPGGYLNVVVGPGRELGDRLLDDPRIGFYAFTGSTEVGRYIQSRIGLRRAGLELGNISGTIICPDADLHRAAQRCAYAAFRKAGQVCTSVQVIYVHQQVYRPFLTLLQEETERLVVGDPRLPETDVGPMITPQEAERIERWIQEAVQQGARVVTGGWRRGSIVAPTVLEGVPETANLRCREAFGPVVSVVPVASLDEAVDAINRSPYGLQAGVFTSRIDQALAAARNLRVGGVIINDTSSTRADPMPYGGVKESGYGKEGPHYAIREMTEERIVVVVP
jgi:acyl-CoA reductase-like NAD-dependent aldehyde dehydrogenase